MLVKKMLNSNSVPSCRAASHQPGIVFMYIPVTAHPIMIYSSRGVRGTLFPVFHAFPNQ